MTSYYEISASCDFIVAPCTISIATHIWKWLSVLFRGILVSPLFFLYSPSLNKCHGHRVSLQWFLIFFLPYYISPCLFWLIYICTSLYIPPLNKWLYVLGDSWNPPSDSFVIVLLIAICSIWWDEDPLLWRTLFLWVHIVLTNSQSFHINWLYQAVSITLPPSSLRRLSWMSALQEEINPLRKSPHPSHPCWIVTSSTYNFSPAVLSVAGYSSSCPYKLQ